MPINVARIIEAPPARVWALLTRVSEWPRWGPSVTAVRCGDETIRLGSTGQVRTLAGIWLPFLVTEFEPGHRWRWRVGGVPATGHRLRPVGYDRCRIVFEVPWWAAPYAAVCRIAIGRIAGICAETGIDPGQ